MDSKLRELDDQRLIATIAGQIAVPRAEVPDHLRSFVLHAPLELMARAALLPLVAPAARDVARERIILLGHRYGAAGLPLERPAPTDFASAAEAIDAVSDDDRSDAAASWLGSHLRPDELIPLAAAVVARLDAAGHAAIYFALLTRYHPRGLPGQMLRHPVHALRPDTGARIDVLASTGDIPVLDALAALTPIGPPPSTFIAPLVQHAQSAGVMTQLTGPVERPFELLRFAAQAMLQGPDEHVPYGWTHHLTLAQAPLLLAGRGVDPTTATFVAAAYLGAFWAGLGEGRVDLGHVPDPVEVDLVEAVAAGPAAASGAAHRAGAGAAAGAVAAELATAASCGHDAHRVKYTLACLDAASTDRPGLPLYLAAAAHLHAWWEHHGDPSDPRPDLRPPTT